MFKLVPLDFTNQAHNDALEQLKSLSLFKEPSPGKPNIEVDKRNYFDDETIEKNVEQISGSYSSLSKLLLRKILPKDKWTIFISKKDQFSLSAIIIGEVNSIWPLVRQYSSSPFFNKDENALLKKKILCHIVQTSEDIFEEFCFRMKTTCDLAAFSRDANLTRIKAQISLEAPKRFNIVSVARLIQEEISVASNPERKRKRRISTIPSFQKFRSKRKLLPSIQVEIKHLQDEMGTLNLHQLKSLIPSGRTQRFPSSTIAPNKSSHDEVEETEEKSPTPEQRPYIFMKSNSAQELRKIKLIEEIEQDLYESREDKTPDIVQDRPQTADADMGRKELPKSIEIPENIDFVKEDHETDIPPLIQAISRRTFQTKRLEKLNEQIVELDKKAEDAITSITPIPPPKYPQPSVVQTKAPHWKTKQTVVSQMFDCQLNDTIDPSTVILQSHKPLFNELSDDIPSTVIKELDSNLFRDGELKEVYAEILKTVHDSYLRFDSDKMIVEPARTSELDIKLLLDSTQPVEVINPKLDTGIKPMQLNMPINQPSDNMSDISKNAQLLHHVYETHNHGDGKAYASWLKWWKATITTDDYFKFLAFQKLDYLHVSFHFYSEHSNTDNELLAAMLEEKRIEMEKMEELRREKYNYMPGMWNANSITMGGLGRDPILIEEEEKADSSSRSRTSPNGKYNVRPSAANATEVSTPRSRQSEKKLSENPLKQVQARLDVIWKTLKMTDKEQLNCALKYSSNQYITILPQIVDSWEEVVNAIVAREKVLAELEVFEEEASDPNRFFCKGRNVRLLEEAKVRSKLYKKLKSLEKAALAFVLEVKKQFNDTVTYNGRDYIDKMRNDKTEMLFWLQQKRRQKLLARENASKKTEACEINNIVLNDGI